jgi:nitrate reductase gamma subunit
MAQFWSTASLTQTLVDKNAGPVAFLYDFLAFMILVGALLALLRRAFDRQMRDVTTVGDVAITAILGGIFVVGFVVEGARLVVSGVPFEQAISSFGGYSVSLLLGLLPVDWASGYPYLWWTHAALVAAFIAYLPFSKLFHMMVSPLLVTISQLVKEE